MTVANDEALLSRLVVALAVELSARHRAASFSRKKPWEERWWD
jgi:hypothetical protein